MTSPEKLRRARWVAGCRLTKRFSRICASSFWLLAHVMPERNSRQAMVIEGAEVLAQSERQRAGNFHRARWCRDRSVAWTTARDASDV